MLRSQEKKNSYQKESTLEKFMHSSLHGKRLEGHPQCSYIHNGYLNGERVHLLHRGFAYFRNSVYKYD